MNIQDVLNETRDFSGKNNNNYKGDRGGRGVRAKHLELEKTKGKKCEICGSTKNLESAEQRGGGYRTLCKSCHSKYDNKADNFNK